MDGSVQITSLLKQLRSDNPNIRNDAARDIWNNYVRDLLALARHRLDQRLCRREAAEDILQSMYNSFFLRYQRGACDPKDRDELWAILVLITQRKAYNASARHRAAKRNVARELPTSYDDPEMRHWALEQIEASGPTPADAAALNEALERRLQDLHDPELRQIALDKLAGWTNREIAVQLKCSEATVERRVKMIRDRWSKELDRR